jgi:hypothetical protein
MRFKPRFDFRKSIDKLLASQGKPYTRLSELETIRPTDCCARNNFKEVVPALIGLDDLILERLRPTIADKSILAPTRYESLLLQAIESLYNASRESGETAYDYCGSMLKYELFEIESISTQKRSSMWS